MRPQQVTQPRYVPSYFRSRSRLLSNPHFSNSRQRRSKRSLARQCPPTPHMLLLATRRVFLIPLSILSHPRSDYRWCPTTLQSSPYLLPRPHPSLGLILAHTSPLFKTPIRCALFARLLDVFLNPALIIGSGERHPAVARCVGNSCCSSRSCMPYSFLPPLMSSF